MKRSIILFTLLFLWLNVFAYDFAAISPSGHKLYYSIVNGNARVMPIYSGPPYSGGISGNLIIPSSVVYFDGNAYTVTSIGDHAFDGCSGMISVSIPNSVTTIGNYAFNGCSGLTSISIPNSVTSLGNYAFCGCCNINSVNIHDAITYIGRGAFSNCTGLSSVFYNATNCSYMGSGLQSFGPDVSGYVFYGCSNITTITIGNNVTNIPAQAFAYCTGLTSLTIPNSVTNIGDTAFRFCSGLNSISIPSSVTNIGAYAFDDCSSLNSITLPNSVNSIGFAAFRGCSSLDSITIPNSITSIQSFTFYGCNSLTSVIIPASVTNIGNYAFYECDSLTSVIIPASVTNIGSYAFTHPSDIYMMSNTPPTLGTYAFGYYTFVSAGSWGYYLNCSIHIPCGSMQSYINGWTQYTNNLTEPDIELSISVICDDSACGSAIVVPQYGKLVRCDSTAIIQANNNYGYHFQKWSTARSANPDTIHLVSDSTIIAYFKRDKFLVSASANYDERGSVVISDTLVAYLDSVDMSAIPNYGYRFDHWLDYDSIYYTYQGYPQYINQDISDTNAARRISINHRRYCVAIFYPVQYHLIVNTDSSAFGSVDGGGVYDYLSEQPIIASANYGYHFTQWNDSVAESYRTITITKDTSFIAYFSPNQYTVTLFTNDSTLGSVTGYGQYYYLDTATLTATPTEHHHFVKWVEIGYDGNNFNLSSNNPYSHLVSKDHMIIAYFAPDTHTVTATSSDISRGMVETTGSAFEYGKPCTLTATAYTGYTFAGWSNGVTANPYTFAVLGDVSLTALFVAEGEETYTVTVVSDDPTMGTVSGGGQALNGGVVEIHAIPNPGFIFKHWNDNDTNANRTVFVTENITYTAYFTSLNSIEKINSEAIKVYQFRSQIVVEGADGNKVALYDLNGRIIATKQDYHDKLYFDVPASGGYLIRIGDFPSRKVVVIR